MHVLKTPLRYIFTFVLNNTITYCEKCFGVDLLSPADITDAQAIPNLNPNGITKSQCAHNCCFVNWNLVYTSEYIHHHHRNHHFKLEWIAFFSVWTWNELWNFVVSFCLFFNFSNGSLYCLLSCWVYVRSLLSQFLNVCARCMSMSYVYLDTNIGLPSIVFSNSMYLKQVFPHLNTILFVTEDNTSGVCSI